MYIKRGVILLVCLMSLSAFASTYKSGHLRYPNDYDIHCSNGQTVTCWGSYEVFRNYPNKFAWQCSGFKQGFGVPAVDCKEVSWSGHVVQFKSPKLAQKDLGNKICAQL